MKQDLPNVFKNEIDKIEVPEHKLNSAIKNGMEKGKKQKKRPSKNKKVLYLTAAALLFFSLLFGSAFIFSPIGTVASKIPYLGSIFETKAVSAVIMDELEEKGYSLNSVSDSYIPKKEIEVNVIGSNDYYNSVKNDIKEDVQQILKAKGYDSYSISITKFKESVEPKLTVKQQKEKSVITEEISHKLKQSNYKFNTVDVDPMSKEIFINLKGSITYYNGNKDEVKKAAEEALNKTNYDGYGIQATHSTPIVIKKVEDIGSKITSVIGEGLLSKKKYKVTEVSYTEEPLTFNIKTSVNSSDPSAKTLSQSIEKEVNQLMELKNVSSKLEGKSYKVIIYSKDDKKIN